MDALAEFDVEAMGAVLADDAVLTMGFIQLPGKGLLLRQLPLLLGEVDIEISEPVVERDRAVAGLTMTRDALGRLEGEARLVVRDGMVSEVELVLARVAVEAQRGRYRLTDPAFTALEGARAVYGELDGTVYRMEVPDDWNGRLVMWAHGFRDFTPELVADIPPMREVLIEKGYAWASSSFSSNGFVPYEAAVETAALQDLFVERFGEPEYSYAVGGSMGGTAVLLSLELYPERYDGALAACTGSGADMFEFLGHYLALGAFAAGVGRDEVGTPTELAALAVTRIMPALEADPDARRVFESLVKEMTGGSRPFRHEGFDAHFRTNFAVLDIARLMMPLDGLFDNTETVYPGAPEMGIEASRVNEQVVRVSVAPSAEPSRSYSQLAGAVPVPLVMMHTTGDGLVPISLMVQFAERAEEAGNGGMVSMWAIRSAGHCDFSASEVEAALDDLAAWVEDGVKAPGEELAGALDDAGRAFTSPLRFGDPGGR